MGNSCNDCEYDYDDEGYFSDCDTPGAESSEDENSSDGSDTNIDQDLNYDVDLSYAGDSNYDERLSHNEDLNCNKDSSHDEESSHDEDSSHDENLIDPTTSFQAASPPPPPFALDEDKNGDRDIGAAGKTAIYFLKVPTCLLP